MSKPFSQSCENNKAAILSVISRYFQDHITVLEIGSYTAQHVRFFAEHLPGIHWQPSDIPANFSLLQAGLVGVDAGNILPPLALDVCHHPWSVAQAGGIFSANTLHIMAAASMADFFTGAGGVLQEEGYLCIYGPFKYADNFTSESNARFEQWLKAQNPLSGIRDSEAVIELARQQGMLLIADHEMPAHNQLLIFQKSTTGC